MSENVVLV